MKPGCYFIECLTAIIYVFAVGIAGLILLPFAAITGAIKFLNSYN